MATFNKFQPFVNALASGTHNLATNQLVVALTNSAPTAADSVLTDISEITYTNLSSRNLITSTSSQTAGVYRLVIDDLVLTSTGGPTGPFQYIVIYNDTAAGDPLIGYYNYGSALTLLDGESLTLDFDGSNGLISLT